MKSISMKPSGSPAAVAGPALLALAVALSAAPAGRAADAPAGISVAGTATVKGRPSRVVITATVAGEAELAADASVKYQDTKRKALAAMAALGNPGLSVDPQGPSVDQATDPAAQQRMMQGMGGGDTIKQRVRVTEQLHLVLKADGVPAEKLTQAVLKVIDAARDAGLQVGPPPPRNWNELQNQSSTARLVSYEIPDASDLQDQAYKAAMADARRKAQRLADLSGVKLGPIVSAQDQGAGPSASDMRAMFYGGGDSAPAEVSKTVTSSTPTDIPVTVRLSVQFEIDH